MHRSTAVCRLHLLVATALLAVIAAASIATAGLLAESKASGGHFAGSGSLTEQVVNGCAAWVNLLLALHATSILGAATILAVVALGLLYLEVRSVARRAPRLVLSRGALGEVAIHLDQVSVLAQRETEHVVGVREVETVTYSSKAGIDVKQRVVVEPQMAFTPLAEQVQHRVKQSLEHHLGFPVAGVQVLLQHASLRKSVL